MTKNPEEIRGGGLLRYCNLITRGFKVIEDDNTNKLQTLERFHRTLNYRGSRIRSSFEMSVVGQCPKKPESAYFMSSISILLQNDVIMMTSFHRKNAIQVLLRFWLVFELLYTTHVSS